MKNLKITLVVVLCMFVYMHINAQVNLSQKSKLEKTQYKDLKLISGGSKALCMKQQKIIV